MNLADFKSKYEELTTWYESVGKLKSLSPPLLQKFNPTELAIIRLINIQKLEITTISPKVSSFIDKDKNIANKWFKISEKLTQNPDTKARPSSLKHTYTNIYCHDLPSIILQKDGILHTTSENLFLVSKFEDNPSVMIQGKNGAQTHLIMDVSDKKRLQFTLNNNPMSIYNMGDGTVLIFNEKCGASKPLHIGIFFLHLFNMHYSKEGHSELTFTEASFKDISDEDYKKVLKHVYPNATLISQLLLSNIPNTEQLKALHSPDFDTFLYDTLTVFYEVDYLDAVFKRYQLCGSKELLYMDISGIIDNLKHDEHVPLPTLL